MGIVNAEGEPMVIIMSGAIKSLYGRTEVEKEEEHGKPIMLVELEGMVSRTAKSSVGIAIVRHCSTPKPKTQFL